MSDLCTDLPLFAMSHRTDPATSKEAIADLTASGIRGQHMQVVLDAVKHNPNLTACELIAVTGLDEYQVRRRLSDLKNNGAIEHSGKRICKVKGTSMVTWKTTSPTLGLLEGVQ
jgi:predicted HTH transcriptional regulator